VTLRLRFRRCVCHFYFGAHDAEAVKRNDGLLGLLGCCGLAAWREGVEAGLGWLGGCVSPLVLRVGAVLLIDINVDGGYADMGVHDRVLAFEFYRLLGAGDGIDGSAKNVARVLRFTSLQVVAFHDLRLALVGIEQKNARLLRKRNPGATCGR